MSKIAKVILISLYIMMVLLTTLYLLTCNQFKASTIGNYTIFAAINIPSIKSGSLVIIKKNISDVNTNDKVFFYNSYNAVKSIMLGEVIKEYANVDDMTFLLSNGKYLSSKYLLGQVDNALYFPLVGYVVLVLTSKLGYLLFSIMPILIILIIQFVELIRKILLLRQKVGG